jgi:adenylate kinase
VRLVFLGPPGAGKGTQAQVLSQRLNVQHVSTGDILRRAVKEGDPVGLKAKGYMDRGELVPDDIVIRIAATRLAQPDMSAGFILDGFPRTGAQAEGLDRTLSDLRINIDLVIYFKTSEGTIIQLLSGSRG